MPTYIESQQRREARCRATRILLNAAPEQLDAWRTKGESRACCVDRLLHLIRCKDVYVALAWMGA